jgi:hypothetical protein
MHLTPAVPLALTLPKLEVYRIRKENVHLEQGCLFNPYGKTKIAKRKVPLSEVAIRGA